MPTGTLPFASPEASRPRVFPVVRETPPAGLHIPGSTLHPPWPCEAKALRIPHIPSSPSASSSLRPFQGVPLPRRVSIFFNSRADPPRLLGNCRHPLADALSAPSRGNSVRFVGCVSYGLVPREKNQSTLQLSHTIPSRRLRFWRNQHSGSSSFTLESLKVIAFDKTGVNRNLSSDNSALHIPQKQYVRR